MSSTLPEVYHHEMFTARRQVFKLFGAAFHLYAMDGSLLGYSKQKAFALKEDIRVFADEAMTREILQIRADRVIDFSAAYQVHDSATGEHFGTLRRKGFKSLFRDSWEILDSSGVVRAKVSEDSAIKAAIRRVIDLASLLMPQTFNIIVDDRVVGSMKQNRNLFVQKFAVDFTQDVDGLLPRPLGVAAVILLLAVEGRQS